MKLIADENNTGPAYLWEGKGLADNEYFDLDKGNIVVFSNTENPNQVTIGMHLTYDQLVKIEVFTLGGKKIQTILDEKFKTGIYKLSKRVVFEKDVFLLKISQKGSKAKRTVETNKLLKV